MIPSGRKGFIFTLLVVVLFMLVLLSVRAWMAGQQAEEELNAVSVRAGAMGSFMDSGSAEAGRMAGISGSRAVRYAAYYASASGVPLADVSANISEVAWDGTLGGRPSYTCGGRTCVFADQMKHMVMSEWLSTLNGSAQKYGMGVAWGSGGMTVAQESYYSVALSNGMWLRLNDSQGTASFNRSIRSSTHANITGDYANVSGFEDPLFPLRTAGYLRRNVTTWPDFQMVRSVATGSNGSNGWIYGTVTTRPGCCTIDNCTTLGALDNTTILVVDDIRPIAATCPEVANAFRGVLSTYGDASVDTNITVPYIYSLQVYGGFLINTTAEFDAGTKNGTATITQNPGTAAANTLELKNGEIVPDANVVGLWHMGEGTDGTTADSSGNGNTGTINGASWSSSGMFGNALSFDGNTNRVSFGSNLFKYTTQTIEMWIKPSVTINSTYVTPHMYVYLWDNYRQGGTLQWNVNYGGDTGRLGFQIHDGSWEFATTNTNVWNAGQWYHVAATFSQNGQVQTYVNGVTDGSPTSIGTITIYAYNPAIGSDAGGGSYGFPGIIDEVAIYDRALSADEIAEQYNSGLKYHTSGNWTSATQIVPPGKTLTDTIINYSGVSADNYIDKIEWLVGGVVKAAYDTNIVSGTSIIIYDENLTSGSFEDVSGDFKIKFYLISDGSGTPAIRSITSTGGALTITNAVDNGAKVLINNEGSTHDVLNVEALRETLLQGAYYKASPDTGPDYLSRLANSTAPSHYGIESLMNYSTVGLMDVNRSWVDYYFLNGTDCSSVLCFKIKGAPNCEDNATCSNHSLVHFRLDSMGVLNMTHLQYYGVEGLAYPND